MEIIETISVLFKTYVYITTCNTSGTLFANVPTGHLAKSAFPFTWDLFWPMSNFVKLDISLRSWWPFSAALSPHLYRFAFQMSTKGSINRLIKLKQRMCLKIYTISSVVALEFSTGQHTSYTRAMHLPLQYQGNAQVNADNIFWISMEFCRGWLAYRLNQPHPWCHCTPSQCQGSLPRRVFF